MMRDHSEDAKVFRALSDVNRLHILQLLRTGERCATDLLREVNVGQSTLSHHMKILRDSGIVACRKDGKWVYYSLSIEGSQYARELLLLLTTPEPPSSGETVVVEE